MKGRFRAFIALAVLALALCLGANIYLRADADSLGFSSELLYGSREAADGVTVSELAVLEDHLSWDMEFDALTGETDTDVRWTAEPLRFQGPVDTYLYCTVAGVRGGFYSKSLPVDAEFYDGIIDDIYQALASGLDGHGEVTKRVYLNDLTEYLPLDFSASADLGREGDLFGRIDLSDCFPVLLDWEYPVDAHLLYSEDRARLDLSVPEGYGCRVSSSSVYAGGDIYMLLTVYGPDGEPLEDALLPGGSWGVYRIPCGEDDGISRVTADPARAQLVYPVSGGADGMKLALSGDGSLLLLFTAEEGTLYLNVLSLDGRLTQRLPLIDEDGLSDSYGQDFAEAVDLLESWPGADSHVVLVADTAIALTESGGEYAPALTADLAGLPVPERYAGPEWDVFGSIVQLATDGERLVLLQDGHLYGDGALRPGWQRLSVFGPGGELLCCEWLESGINSWNVMDWVATYPDAGFTAEVTQ